MGAGVLTAVTVVFLLGLAILTVLMAVYEPDPVFGGFADYFKVFTAAVGSTTAAAVVTVLLLWSDKEVSS